MTARRGDLNAKQRRFVDEYLIDLNATQAAIRSGYSKKSAGIGGFDLLKNPNVAAAIEARMKARAKRADINQDRVLLELARIGFSDIRRVIKWGPNGATLKQSSEITEDDAAAISEISQTAHGIKIKFHSKPAALQLLGQHLGTFKDGNGSEDEAPLPVSVVVNVVDASTPRDNA